MGKVPALDNAFSYLLEAKTEKMGSDEQEKPAPEELGHAVMSKWDEEFKIPTSEEKQKTKQKQGKIDCTSVLHYFTLFTF